MNARRTRPLVLLLFAGCALLAARLFEIQVLESSVWAEEAASLVRSGEIVPFRRGAILDAQGQALVRDEPGYELVLTYRDFRRGHPLGQVAHARGALLQRSLGLDEAATQLEPWALELVALAPADLDRFGRGAGLRAGTLEIAPSRDPGGEGRRQRAADANYYIGGLLGFETRHWRELKRRPELRALPFDALAAELGLATSAERARAELCARLAQALDDLRRLAALMRDAQPGVAPLGPDELLGGIVDELEATHRSVDELAASWLWSQVTGFPAGRLAPETLCALLDTHWLRAEMRWEPARVEPWAREARARYLTHFVRGRALPGLAAAISALPESEPAEELRAERILDLLGTLYDADAREPYWEAESLRSWRSIERLSGFDELFESLEQRAQRAGDAVADAAPALPLVDPALRRLPPDAQAPWRLLALAGANPAEWSAALAPARRAERVERLQPLVRALIDAWEARFQAVLAAQLRARLAPGGAPLAFNEDALESISDASAYALKDFGSRPVPLESRPGYEAVLFATRDALRLRGIEARPVEHRIVLADGALGRPLAAALLGAVGRGAGNSARAERERDLELRELRRLPKRNPQQEQDLAVLIGERLLAEQVRGVLGLEACFDPWLRGRNGYREQLSLERAFGDAPGAHLVRPVEHGQALRLTLDSALQRAAERALERPDEDPDANHRDPEWQAHPHAALVLLDVDGDVLAAASAPGAPRAWGELSAAERAECVERALHAPGFQPPGSVFKPFVAAWALEHMRLDPAQTVSCATQADGHAGYKGLRCSEAGSHSGPMVLRDALKYSCNSYFAALGERYEPADFLAMAREFGFGQPTGVRPAGAGGRIEDVPALPTLAAVERDRMRAANGLVVMQATPLQVARAFAGLATGSLPSARLVSAIGGRELEREPARRLALSEASLARVREALGAVSGERGGTAHRALASSEVGYTLAAKTGSADLESRRADNAKVKKHGWVACWFPAEQPRFVLVALCSETLLTSSHSVVWIARQFLRDAEARAALDARLGAGGAR